METGHPCEICGYNLVTDTHHWSKTETSYLCSNCHNIIHRLVNRIIEGQLIKNTHKRTIQLIKIAINTFHTKEITKKEFLNKRKGDLRRSWERIINYKELQGEKLCFISSNRFDAYGKIEYRLYYGRSLSSFLCEICGYDITTDLHHFGNKDCDKNKFFGKPSVYRSNRKSIILCPNHHSILHRILKDYDGTKYNSKVKIIEEIKKIEELK